jgi:hypothetical protein
MEYDNTNQGAIWKNEKKETATHPDFTGSLNVDGVEYWVSAWKRGPAAKEKAPALKFSIKAKEERHAQGMQQAKEQVNRENVYVDDKGDFDDLSDIPF